MIIYKDVFSGDELFTDGACATGAPAAAFVPAAIVFATLTGDSLFAAFKFVDKGFFYEIQSKVSFRSPLVQSTRGLLQRVMHTMIASVDQNLGVCVKPLVITHPI